MRNVLLGYVRRGVLTIPAAGSLLTGIRERVRVVETPDDFSLLQLAWDRHLTAYDATYVATARSFGVK